MSQIVNFLIDFIYPNNCVCCGKLEELICDKCLNSLEYAEQICPECGEESVLGWTHEPCKKKLGMDGLIAIYAYQDENIRKIVDKIKFDFSQEMIKTIMDKCSFELGARFDMVVPIPLHFYRENWRGFNQAQRIAEIVSRKTGIELKEVLIKKKKTQQQSMSKSRDERFKNVKDVYKVIAGRDIKDKNILLVDDVFTSGASMREACKELKKAGAALIWGFCMAH